ncbi:MAG: A/G-specific adenine glycosylase [Chitinophagales bacterium]
MKTSFTKKLLRWHRKNMRDLPWKKTKDPYKIWLSEIILQQTRVEQGLPYYEKMIRLFPSVKHLAAASDDEVMHAWQGLGYYSRARNLHSAARQIVNELNGKFPSTYDDILKLKGVGNYTAAAIASFAFDLPYAVVDGNVYRVLARAFGIKDDINGGRAKKKFSKLANEILDKKNPAAFNQAIMDFGSLVCTPANPKCDQCFFRKSCYARTHEAVEDLPRNRKNQKIKLRWFNFFVLEKNDQLIIEKRTAGDIWEGLYQFPMIETSSFQKAHDILQLAMERKFFSGRNPRILNVSPVIEHKLSHQTIRAQFILAKRNNSLMKQRPEWKQIGRGELKKFAFPKLIVSYYEKYLH